MQEPAKAARAMRTALHSATDDKIRRIVSMLDVVDADTNRTILDPLRDRLAILRPLRPLRFNRLLFMPLDPIIVPARHWRPDQASVPRTVLAALLSIMKNAPDLGLPGIERRIGGCSTEASAIITSVGEELWPRAAEILAAASMPTCWPETGLPPSLYRPLVDAIAAVLRRGPQLRQLQRDGSVGVLEPDQATLDSLLQDLAQEAPDACTMIMRLILGAAPAADGMLRRLIARRDAPADRLKLQQALQRASGHMLDDMEQGTAFSRTIGTASAAGVAEHVGRTIALLDVLQEEGGRGRTSDAGPRVRVIRDRLDRACRARVADEIEHALVGPIGSATAPVQGVEQERFEACARDLRAIETVARRIGGAAEYDALLSQAANAVSEAAGAGLLTVMRQIRLVEILQGPEAAHRLYQARLKATAGVPSP